jgi:hypothetical protein
MTTTVTRPLTIHHAPARRADLLAIVALHEDATRRVVRNDTSAEAEALWQATWNLRKDVIAALERCETAEAQALWARNE